MNARTPHNVVPDYISHGWQICAVAPGTKGPNQKNWNLPENALKSIADIPEGWGCGLMHSLSGTAAFDIDDGVATREWFKERGIDIKTWFTAHDSVQIDSGNPGHAKLLFALPGFIGPLPTKKVIINGKTGFELRCATAEGNAMQDILPPSKHPTSGQSYQWAGNGSWQSLPTIPTELLAVWQELLEMKHEPASVDPDKPVDMVEIKSALEKIPASCDHDTWLTTIMALHSTGHADAYEVAREWSKSCPEKYPGDRTFDSRWRSFSTDKANVVTIGSLFHLAKERGWIAPPVDVTKLFNGNSTPPDILAEMFLPPPKIDPNLFPPVLRDYALDVARSVGCDPAVSLMGGLIALSTAIDSRSRLTLRSNNKFIVPPNLWAMTIADSGDKKSPGSKPMLAPLFDIERDDKARYQLDLQRWEAEEAAWAAAKKDFIARAGDTEHALASLGEGDILTSLPTIPTLRSAPVPKRLVTMDSTSQKFVAMCAERPYGMLVNLDEGNGFLTKLAAQNGVDDRSTWVVSYESDPYSNDRVGSGSVFCENLSSSIYCNVQPKVFRKVGPALETDGCSQRFIPVVLDSRLNSAGDPSINPDSSAWRHLLVKAHAIGYRTYTLSEEASVLFEQWLIDADEMKVGLRLCGHSDYTVSAHSKFPGLTGRIALNFHVATDCDSVQVSADTMRRAIRFVRRYVSNSVIYTDEYFLGQKNLSRWVCEKILDAAPDQTITMSQLKRSAERQTEDMPDHIAEVRLRYCMDELEARQWVAITEENRKTIQWAINPNLVEVFKAQRAEITRKRLEFKEKLRATFHGRKEVE